MTAIARPELIEVLQKYFGPDVIAVTEEGASPRDLAHIDGQGIQLGTASALWIHFKDRVVSIEISEWGRIDLRPSVFESKEGTQ